MKKLVLLLALAAVGTQIEARKTPGVKKLKLKDVGCESEFPSKKDEAICESRCSELGLKNTATRCSGVRKRIECRCK